jgi:large subunit ribosomal protein L15
MNLHTLKPAEGATHKVKRVGRGQGSGGTTAGKGNKGQKSRTGYQSKKGFEGGQMPIQRRQPKRGFKNMFRVEYKVLNLSQIDAIVEKFGLEEISADSLYVHGLLSRTDLIKILGNGEMKTKINFKVNAVSGKAKEAIEAAGGTVEIL